MLLRDVRPFHVVAAAAAAMTVMHVAEAQLLPPILPPLLPQTFYVRANGNDANDGLSAARAFRTIQKGINSCTVRGSTVYVGPGRYQEMLQIANKTRPLLLTAPFSVIGDGLGEHTMDTPGDVIIDGDNRLAYGINMQQCDDFYFENLTFANQTQYAVYGSKLDGFKLIDCVIDVPPYYGVCLSDVKNVDVRNNELIRDATSGHGIYSYITGGSNSNISENRLSMTGSLYRSTNFRAGQVRQPSTSGSATNSASLAYSANGITAMAYNTNASMLTVQNNVISDAYLGLYVYSLAASASTQAVVSNNTVTASYYGINIYGPKVVTFTCTNNLVTDCYITHSITAPQANVNGLMASASVVAPTLQANLLSQVITDVPHFKDAAGGDFSLARGSRGIDEGVATGAPTRDVMARARPFDGDRNGSSLYDIGAFESNVGSRVRVVRFRGINRDGEAEPAKDYEDALLARLGANLATTVDTTLTKVSTTLTSVTSATRSLLTIKKRCNCSSCSGSGCGCGCKR